MIFFFFFIFILGKAVKVSDQKEKERRILFDAKVVIFSAYLWPLIITSCVTVSMIPCRALVMWALYISSSQ